MCEIFLGVEDPNIFSYSRLYHFWKKRILISKLFAYEVKRNKDAIKVLDVGCGKGGDLFYINSVYHFTKSVYVGVDLSKDFTKYCDAAKNAKKISNMNFVVGNIENLSFKDKSFDVAICSEVLEHMPNQNLVISEIKRTLKDGGAFVITTPNRCNYFLKIADFFRILGLWKQKYENHTDSLPYVYGEGFSHISVRSVSELKNIFNKAGFKIQSIKRGAPIAGGIYYDSFNLLFAFLIIIDVILDYLPFTHNFSETLIMKLRKRYG